MSENEESLTYPANFDELLDSDVDGLLDTAEKSKKISSADRLTRGFLEIVEFRRIYGRIPSSSTREIAERKLGARLDGILVDDKKTGLLKELDELGILQLPDAPSSLEDLLSGDDLDLLADDSGLMDLSGLPVRRQIYNSDGAARRRKAQNFDAFESLFKQKHVELTDGTSKLLPYPGAQHIVPGAFFILNGVMLLVVEVGDAEYKKTTVRENKRERLHCVFENGVESSMYRQSLAIRLSDENGQIVVPSARPELFEDDQVSGFIYVLRSRSTDPQIAAITDLHKIGFTRGSVELRIRGAEKSPTYLMAPVEVVASYRLYNLKASVLETLLHRIFSEVRLDVSQVDRWGRGYDADEWFVVPRDVIDEAIGLIESGAIVDYVYDAQLRRLVKHPA